MKRFSIGGRLLAFLLAVLMTVGAVPVLAIGVAAETADGDQPSEFVTGTKPTAQEIKDGAYTVGDGEAYRIVMLDCGRKYFTVSQIKTLIDILERNGYNQLQLSFGNDGFRFLLDDMTLTYDNGGVTTKTMDSATLKANLQTGNTASPNTRFENTNCLTESEMDEILVYAGKHNIEIVPMINMPGHAYALVYGSGYAAEFQGAWGKHDDLNTNSAEAVNFAYAVLEKYATYFKDRGVRFFNFGADECGEATTVDFVLGAAKTIYDAGLTPRCFNDVFNSSSRLTSLAKLKDYGTQICFWAQYSSSYVTGIQTAESVAAAGYDLINTNQNWYYVVNQKENGINYETVNGVALQLPNNAEDNQGYADLDDFCTRQGSTGVSAVKDVQLSSKYKSQIKGSMFCLWFDYPALMTADQILSTTNETGAGYQLNVLANVYWPQDVKASVASEWSNVKTMSADTYYENGTMLQNGGAATWLATNRPNGISGVNNVKFRGWAGTEGNEVISAFGYSIDNSIDNVVWDTGFIKTAESGVTNAGGSNAKRYEITVDLSKYPESETHTVTLLVRTVTGKIYKLNEWGNGGTVNFKGNLKVVGNSTEAKGRYMDAFKLADISLTGSNGGDVMGQLNAMGNTVTIDAGIAHDKAFFQGWIGFAGKKIEKIGYTVDGKDIVWEGGTINRTPEAAVTNAGGEYAIRLTMNVPTANLTVGTHTISVVMQLSDGTNVSFSSVKVVVEDETTLPRTTLTFERFVTSQYADDNPGEYTTDQKGSHKYTINPEDAYSAEGAEVRNVLPKICWNENGNESWYWKGTILTGEYKQGSNQHAKDDGGSINDMSGKGTDFFYVRFWQGKWSIKNTSGVWVDVQSTDQVVAYYMQLSRASKEINVTFRDYAQNAAGTYVTYPNIKKAAVYQNGSDVIKELNAGGGAYPGEEYAGGWTNGFYGVGSAVVYPDGSLSLTEKQIWDQTLLLFYDKTTVAEGSKFRSPGVIKAYDTEDYVVTKITITRGHHVPVKHGISENDDAWKTQRYWYGDTDYVKWNKVKVGDNEWYDEDILWTREEGEDYSSGILLEYDDDGNYVFENYRTSAGVVGEAYLLLFYVEPVVNGDDLEIVYVDDSTLNPTEIIRKGAKVVDGKNFLNSLTVGSQTGNWSAGQLTALTTGKTLSILNNTNTVQPINYEKLSLVPDIGEVDKKYVSGDYYYTKAEISADGKTLYLHYELKDSIKVQYWYDPIDGSDSVLIDLVPDYLIYVKNDRLFTTGIAVDGTVGTYTAEQLTALIKEGHSFTILGLTARDEAAAEEDVTIYTALADVTGRINTDSKYDDFRNHPEKYSFVEAKLSEDGKLLTLHYTKKTDLKVVWYDDDASEAITEDPNFAETPEETFDKDGYDPDETVVITDKDGTEKPVETDLDKVIDPEDKDKYEDHYFDGYEVSEDGTTLVVHYKKKVKLTVNYYDQRRTGADGTGKYLFYTTSFDGKADAKWNGTDKTTNWTAQPFEGDTYTAYIALADLMSKHSVTLEEPYNIEGMYSIHHADLSADGLTLNLYYMYAKGTDLNIVWIDDSKTSDDNEITSWGIPILNDFRYYFTEAQRAAITGEPGNVITVTNYVLETSTYPTNLKDLVKKYSDVSSDYASDKYYFVEAVLSSDNKTLELHYNVKKDLKVSWQVKDTGYEFWKDDSSAALLGNLATVEWNGTSLSDGTYTAETDLTKITGVETGYQQYYEYTGEYDDSTDTLILYYAPKTVKIVVNRYDQSNSNYLFHTTGQQTVTLEDAQILRQFSETTGVNINGLLIDPELENVTAEGFDHGTYNKDNYYFVTYSLDEGETEAGVWILDIYYNKYKTMTVHWVDKNNKDYEFKTETVKKVKQDGTWNKTTLSIDGGDVTYTAQTAPSTLTGDYKYYSYIDSAVNGNDLYLYYGYTTVNVEWRDRDGDDKLIYRSTDGYNIGYGENLATSGILTDVTISGQNATLGTAPKLVDWKNVSNPIYKDLVDLGGAVTIDAMYMSGLYSLVEAKLSADKKTLILYYDVDTSDMLEDEFSYVLDYGLPVKIEDVRSLFAEAYGIPTTAIASVGLDLVDVDYASVTMGEDDWSLTYALWTFMKGVDMVQLTAALNTLSGAQQAILTIHFIPANVMYYEDNFGEEGVIDFVDADGLADELGRTDDAYQWHSVGTDSDLYQQADRVGDKAAYGSDVAYAGYGFSAHTAMSVTVPAGVTDFDNLPKFSFTFKGTGFDIVSRTGLEDGRIGVVITNADGEQVNEREYGVILRGDNELYQVPVMSVEGLAYGEYTVTVTVYPPMKMLERESHEVKYLYGTADGATFVLDGIRIYDSVDVSEDSEHEDAEMVLAAYQQDMQVVVDRREIRDLLINAGEEITVTVDQYEGSEADLAGFTAIGPNNEVYLAPGQSITIKFSLKEGENAYLRYRALKRQGNIEIDIYADGDRLTEKSGKVTTSTDQALSVAGVEGDTEITLVIRNPEEADASATAGALDQDQWLVLTDLITTMGGYGAAQ